MYTNVCMNVCACAFPLSQERKQGCAFQLPTTTTFSSKHNEYGHLQFEIQWVWPPLQLRRNRKDGMHTQSPIHICINNCMNRNKEKEKWASISTFSRDRERRVPMSILWRDEDDNLHFSTSNDMSMATSPAQKIFAR